jgi:spore coat protein F
MNNDPIYALDLVLMAKIAVKDTAIAISETSTPYIREALLKQFHQNVAAHATAFQYTLSQGITPTYVPEHLVQMDFRNAIVALKMPIPTAAVKPG